MANEFRGIKEGDHVEATLVRRKLSYSNQPWAEETWEEITHWGKAFWKKEQVRCPECDGRTHIPPIDYTKPLNYCKRCDRKGTIDSPTNGGELCLKTTKGFHGPDSGDLAGKPIEWTPSLSIFRDLNKVPENKAGQDATRRIYEIKEGKQVPTGTAKLDWISAQKKIEQQRGRSYAGDWRYWERQS